MSYETDEMFEQEESSREDEAKVERAKAIRTTLKKTKPFKDLLVGKDKEWSKVKEAVALHCYNLPAIGNDIITKDFLAGIRYFQELVDAYVSQFDEAFKSSEGV
jgi:hypothetical protein